MNTKVRHSASRMINLNDLEMIGHCRASEIKNNNTEVIGGDMAVYVGPSQSGKLVPEYAMTYKEGIGNLTNTLGTPKNVPQGAGNLKVSVEQNRLVTVGATSVEEVKEDKRLFVKKSYMQDIDEDIVTKAGENIILQCGKSKIILSKDGTIRFYGEKLISTQKDSTEFYADIVKIN